MAFRIKYIKVAPQLSQKPIYNIFNLTPNAFVLTIIDKRAS